MMDIITNTKMSKKTEKIEENIRNGIKVNSEDFYYETQEIIFNEIVTDNAILTKSLEKAWNSDLFTPRPYNSEFWNKYSSMVETETQRSFREALEKELSNKNEHKTSSKN